ncbi:DUF1365 domain-containing protein [Kutzneria buriramensis]|uniref:DUF1365 family protein n=1 Tax=Kutzneria buriramensis TaxID=1045776 RepID=A0A3E0GZ00_9PSEU|nr:DUF1365 domain-containing protein [Kutzneria buriramensis]REH32616.1 hypothetical protein BCF44_121165 [Kutzneria buriramensis]
MVAAALYDAEVAHSRRERVDHAFKHRVFLWLVDLDELPTLPRWLRPFARFEARDHLGVPSRTIRQNLDAFLAFHGVDLHGGRVLMLANARSLGHVFNPLTVYWCHRGTELACVVAEVHNTYGERHCYLLFPDEAGRARTDKVFYVSPFLTVGGEYLMRFGEPGPKLSVTIALRQGESTPLTATLRGRRLPATPSTLVGLLLRRPLTTHRVSALIRRHGIGLWLRRIPIVPRTPHKAQETVQ